MRNIRSISGVLDRQGADMSILIDIELRVLIEISRFCHDCRFELNMEGIRVLKILDRHDLKLLLNGFPQRSI
jgi:hypothetical protein